MGLINPYGGLDQYQQQQYQYNTFAMQVALPPLPAMQKPETEPNKILLLLED